MEDRSEKLSALNIIFSHTVIEEQIEQLIRLKFNQIFLYVGQLSSALTDIIDSYKNRNVEIILIRTALDLKSKLGGDPFLLLGDSIIIKDEIIVQHILKCDQKPKLFVLDSRDENAAFERLDLNNRWAGLALLSGNIFSNITNVADDWSVESLLVRMALQQNMMSEQLPNHLVRDCQILLIKNRDDVKYLSDRKFSELKNKISSGSIFNAVTFFWSKNHLKFLNLKPLIWAVQLTPILFLIAALLFIYYDEGLWALTFAAISSICFANQQLMNKLSSHFLSDKNYSILMIFLSFIFFAIFYKSLFPQLFFGIFMSILMVGILILTSIRRDGFYRFIDPISILISLILAEFFNQSVAVSMIIIGGLFSHLIWENFQSRNLLK